jgi:hypothetical protein
MLRTVFRVAGCPLLFPPVDGLNQGWDRLLGDPNWFNGATYLFPALLFSLTQQELDLAKSIPISN